MRGPASKDAAPEVTVRQPTSLETPDCRNNPGMRGRCRPKRPDKHKRRKAPALRGHEERATPNFRRRCPLARARKAQHLPEPRPRNSRMLRINSAKPDARQVVLPSTPRNIHISGARLHPNLHARFNSSAKAGSLVSHPQMSRHATSHHPPDSRGRGGERKRKRERGGERKRARENDTERHRGTHALAQFCKNIWGQMGAPPAICLERGHGATTPAAAPPFRCADVVSGGVKVRGSRRDPIPKRSCGQLRPSTPAVNSDGQLWGPTLGQLDIANQYRAMCGLQARPWASDVAR